MRKDFRQSFVRRVFFAVVGIVFVGICGLIGSEIFAPVDYPVSKDRHIALDYDGIDVSHHQGVIDWKRVAHDPNIQFVYVKATEGSSHTDTMFERNMRGARAAGLNVGAYHYLTSSSAVVSQFVNFKSRVIAKQQMLIPMVDVEWDGVRGWTRQQLQDSLSRFMKLVEKHYGRAPILYSYTKFYNENLAPEFNRYFLFIARYSSNSPIVNGAGRHHIWQHSDQGVVDGISTPVDLDVFESGTTLSDILLR